MHTRRLGNCWALQAGGDSVGGTVRGRQLPSARTMLDHLRRRILRVAPYGCPRGSTGSGFVCSDRFLKKRTTGIDCANYAPLKNVTGE